MNTLSTKQATISYKEVDKTVTDTLLDFTVDGISLRERAGLQLSTGLQDAFVQEEKRKYLKRLLGELPPDLEDNRTALYICPVDGDLECGAVGCQIDFQNDSVTWSDFDWNEVDSEEDAGIAELRSYTFDRQEYEAVIRRLLDKYR